MAEQGTEQFTQFHVDKEALGGLKPLGVPLGTHDGVAIMEADSLESFLSVCQLEFSVILTTPMTSAKAAIYIRSIRTRIF